MVCLKSVFEMVRLSSVGIVKKTFCFSFSGDVLIYLNGTNILKPPIALSIDRVKSEFTALRRQNRSIQIGICRYEDRALMNNTTIKHLGSLTPAEFESLALENRKSSSDSKKILNLFSNKRKSVSNSKQNSNRDSGFVETDRKSFFFKIWIDI